MASPSRRLGVLQGHLHTPQSPAITHLPLASQSCTASLEPDCSSKFEFSTGNGKLTVAQRQFYEENGYLVVPKLISEQEVARFTQHFRDLCSGRAKKAPGEVLMREAAIAKSKDKQHLRGEEAIHKVQDFENDEVLFSYGKLSQILDYVTAIIGPDVRSINTLLINKPPHIGKSGSYMWHQDLYYFPLRPSNRMVTTWTALEPATCLNGCLEFVPGTHTNALRNHGYLPDYSITERNTNYHGILDHADLDRADRVYIEIGAGDTVFFNPNLCHGSGPNRSNGYRKAIGVHYAATDCEFIDVQGTCQEQIGKEMSETWSKRIGKRASFQDVWRWKSRLVTGRDREWWALEL